MAGGRHDIHLKLVSYADAPLRVGGFFGILRIKDGVTPESRGFCNFFQKEPWHGKAHLQNGGVRRPVRGQKRHPAALRPHRPVKTPAVGENGYRYYSARQLPTYDLIAALQRLGTPLAEIRDYLNRRSPEALLSLLEEKEAALEAERRRLEQMGRLLEDTVDKVRQARSVRPGDFFLEEQPEILCAVVPAPKIHNETFDEAVYLLHIRQLLAWARANGIPSQAPGDIICRETLERGEVTEDFYYCPVPSGTTGWPTRVRPAGTYAVPVHQGSYQSGVRRQPRPGPLGGGAGVPHCRGLIRRGSGQLQHLQ